MRSHESDIKTLVAEFQVFRPFGDTERYELTLLKPSKRMSVIRSRKSVSEGNSIAQGLDTASTAHLLLGLLDCHNSECEMYSIGHHRGLPKNRIKKL